MEAKAAATKKKCNFFHAIFYFARFFAPPCPVGHVSSEMVKYVFFSLEVSARVVVARTIPAQIIDDDKNV